MQEFCWNIWWTESCLRNKFSFYLSTDSVSTLLVECTFFFTPTLLIQFPALNLIDISYFDSCSWGLFDSNDTNNSFNKEQQKNHLLSFTFFLKEKESISSVVGRAKLPISIYIANKKEMEVLMPIREIGLSGSCSQKYPHSLQVNLASLHMIFQVRTWNKGPSGFPCIMIQEASVIKLSNDFTWCLLFYPLSSGLCKRKQWEHSIDSFYDLLTEKHMPT